MKKRIRSQIARGSAELAILALLAEQALYGFEISKQIEERTEGALHFTLASLYPMLYENISSPCARNGVSFSERSTV